MRQVEAGIDSLAQLNCFRQAKNRAHGGALSKTGSQGESGQEQGLIGDGQNFRSEDGSPRTTMDDLHESHATTSGKANFLCPFVSQQISVSASLVSSHLCGADDVCCFEFCTV